MEVQSTSEHQILQVSGKNEYSQLGEKSNNEDVEGDPAISPPIESDLDLSTLLSYSTFSDHTVLVTLDGIIKAVGDNREGQISVSLPDEKLSKYTTIEPKDINGSPIVPISAVCGYTYTLYLTTSLQNKNQNLLAYNCAYTKSAFPLFLDINDRNPIAIFGGRDSSAAIDDDGQIIFIPGSAKQIHASKLPDGEKASSVACGHFFIAALSSNGHVFLAYLAADGTLNEFVKVDQLEGIEIVDISGTNEHLLAVSDEGRVFGLGSNDCGQLGIGEDTEKVEKFIEIHTLSKYKITNVYAGCNHSLFLTSEGRILACGANAYGQLLINKRPSYDNYYLPVETTVTSGATYAIAGSCVSAVFINGCPPHCPNRRISSEKVETRKDEEPISKAEKEIASLKEEVSRLKKENEILQKKLEKSESRKVNQIELFDSNKIDHIRRIDTIISQSNSDVFKVSNESQLVLKIIKLKTVNRHEDFLHEYERINNLNNRNIARVIAFSYGDDSHCPSILIELCNCNLRDAVRQLTDVQRVTAIYEISRAMNDAHENGFVHRNLKPENILLDASMHVKVTDFAIEKLKDVKEQIEEEQSKSDSNSIEFIAPEIRGENEKYDNKVDVYSFGAIVSFILTEGQYVGMGDRFTDGCVNERSILLVKKCMSANPEERPSFGQILEFIESNEFELIDNVKLKITQIKEFLSI